MTTPQLNHFIDDLRRKGSENLDFYIVEKYRRNAVPFSTIILTIIAFAITIRKRRSGMGIYLVIGLGLCGVFVFIQQFSVVFATKGNLNPFWGAWIPNIFFGALSILLLVNFRK
jgi:lipopolysaccharide export system permease protein